MTNPPVSLLDLFPEMECSEADRALLIQNTVTDLDLHPTRREVSVCIQSSAYLPLSLLRNAEEQIRKAYLLRSTDLRVCYPAALLPELEISDLVELFSPDCPTAPAILAGCNLRTEGGKVHLNLKSGGADTLRPNLRRVEQRLSEAFSSPVRLELHAEKELTAEELFRQTEQMREHAVEAIPKSAPRPGTPAPVRTVQPTSPWSRRRGRSP